ncbi:interferon-induced protein 44-like isoform X1 [Sparus aurata]|uniref:interferon-induced protein 44-like isoform X1 n=1 Tax=Sparus aurata TaxID=8175 RepID=UPI0011C0EA75|nr:interferon-induced protein 44-like isoform X1 [Sparus aurata]
MGGKKSKPVEAPLLVKPWRQVNWRDDQSALQFVNNYKPHVEGQQIRVLLHGPVGAGKSSFINSVQSVLHGRISVQALVDNATHDCFTKQYKTYKIQKGNPDTFYPFVLNDIMGLKCSNRRSSKIHLKDMKRVLKGNVKDGYTFNADCKISKEDRHYNTSPTLNDKVHVLVCVIDANTTSLIKDEVLMGIQDIRDEASELGIPQVAIFTKIDQACPETQEDVKNVYRSKLLKQKIEQFSADVGIPLNCIFPVKNYHEESDLDTDTNTLILNALRNIIHFGNDFLNHKNA